MVWAPECIVAGCEGRVGRRTIGVKRVGEIVGWGHSGESGQRRTKAVTTAWMAVPANPTGTADGSKSS